MASGPGCYGVGIMVKQVRARIIGGAGAKTHALPPPTTHINYYMTKMSNHEIND